MRRKEQEELSVEAPQYMSARKITNALIAIASAISYEDKIQYQIPKYIDLRSTRRAFARQSLGEASGCDAEHLEAATNIVRWLSDRVKI